MAILGYDGLVELSREWPSPTVLVDSRLQRGASPSLDLTNQAFQAGDEVLLLSLRGVPLSIGLAGAAPCPDGYAFWTDTGTAVGPALAARTAGGTFWSADPSQPFWESAATVGFSQSASAFIGRDELDDVRFYASELDGVNGGSQGLIPMINVSPGTMLILPAAQAGNTAYVAAALQLLQEIGDSPVLDGEQPAENITSVPQILLDVAASAEERGWLVQCDLTGWVFEMDATQLDETAIGQLFGESARGLLRGAGSFNANISHRYVTGENSSVGMLRLVMLTGHGSKARARFQIVDQRKSGTSDTQERLFYETDILLSRSSINTQFDDVIRMTAEFVATGRIQLAKER